MLTYIAYQSLHVVCNVTVFRKTNGDRNQLGSGVRVTQNTEALENLNYRLSNIFFGGYIHPSIISLDLHFM